MRILLKLSVLIYIVGLSACLMAMLIIGRFVMFGTPHSMWLGVVIIAVLILGRFLWDGWSIFLGVGWKKS